MLRSLLILCSGAAMAAEAPTLQSVIAQVRGAYGSPKVKAEPAIGAFTANPGLPDSRQRINAWGDDGSRFTKRSAGAIARDPKLAEAARMVGKCTRCGTIPLDDPRHEQRDGPRSLTEVAWLARLELGPSKFDFIDSRFLSKRDDVEISE